MIRLGAALALTLAAIGSAAAHETTLYPSQFTLAAGAPLTVSLSSTETFPTFETGPKPERVARTVAWIGARPAALDLSAHAETALRFTLPTPRAGVAVIGVSLKPRDIDLEPGKVAEYFAEIDPPAATRAALPAGAALHETYTKYAKAIVCVAPCADWSPARRALGDALEFVPGPDGRTFTLIARDAPAVRFAVTVWDAHAHVLLHTDAFGHFTLPTEVRGPTMLSATILRPPVTPRTRFASDFATLTFEAR